MCQVARRILVYHIPKTVKGDTSPTWPNPSDNVSPSRCFGASHQALPAGRSLFVSDFASSRLGIEGGRRRLQLIRQMRPNGWGLGILGMLAVAACANHGTSAAGPIDSSDAQAVDAREAGVSGDGDMAPPPRDAPSEGGPPDPGSAGGAGGSGSDSGSSQPSPPVMIALLPAVDALRPFQHAAEVSVAALGDDVVVSAINIHTDGPDTLDASELLRQVGGAVSHDGGDTFAAPVNPGFTNAETSDPVVLVTRDGSFWLAAMGIDEGGNRGLLLRSQDGGRDFA